MIWDMAVAMRKYNMTDTGTDSRTMLKQVLLK